MPDNIELTDDQFGRLPVLAAMVKDIVSEEQQAHQMTATLSVTVPDDMSASDILEYSSYEDAAVDYALSGNLERDEITRRTLDWCGIDMSLLLTPRELRFQLQQEKQNVERLKLELFKVAHLDCIEFVNTRLGGCSHFVASDFDVSLMDEEWKVKTMDDIIERWKQGPSFEVDGQTRYDLLYGMADTDECNMDKGITKGGKRVFINTECLDAIMVVRDAHGCKRVV